MSQFAALHIDFAPRTLRYWLLSTPLWVTFLGVLGLVMILTALVIDLDVANQSQVLNDALLQADKLQKARRGTPARPLVIPEARALRINAAIQQLNLPWSDVFDAIEDATPKNIALVSIEPDAKKQTIKGQAEALTSDDMIEYVERLKKQSLFVNVLLLKHEVNQQDPYKPYRFDFEAQWKATPP